MKRVELKDGVSAEIIQQNVQYIKDVFPEAITENSVNFDTLRQLLGDLGILEEGEEKYGLNWHGKKQALQIALTPSHGTLQPCPEESMDWDATQNLFIEGDNLEILKLLQKSYANKVKVIYIDPPYNTDNDFIYPDKFTEGLETYLKYTGQKGYEGWSVSESARESNGRRHTNWLNMIYPRLRLARNLLTHDGILAISIDDNEISNLLQILEEIFGQNTKVIAVKMSEPTGVKMASVNKEGTLAKLKEYVVLASKGTIRNLTPEKTPKNGWDREYGTVLCNLTKSDTARVKQILSNEERTQDELDEFDAIVQNIETKSINQVAQEETGKEVSQEWLFKNAWRIARLAALTGGARDIAKAKKREFEDKVPNFFSIVTPKRKCYLIKGSFNVDSNEPRCKVLFADDYLTLHIGDFWQDIKTTGLDNEGFVPFRNGKKPIKLLSRIFDMATKENDLVMDFFAGSGSSAQAVMELNVKNKSNLRFILAQLPEKLDPKNKEQKETYDFCVEHKLNPNIAEISKERIRLSAKKIKTEQPEYYGDLGFKVFKLSSSNIRIWNPDQTDLANSLLDHLDHLVEGCSEQDILYELLLKRGVELTTPIETKEIASKNVHNIGNGKIIACLDDLITRNDVENLASGILDWYKILNNMLGNEKLDTHVFFKDSAFSDDIVKTNMAAILFQNGIEHVRSL